jgi:hypothetical protein
LVATAVLKLSPFRWITFVQDRRERDRMENIDEAWCRTRAISKTLWGKVPQ